MLQVPGREGVGACSRHGGEPKTKLQVWLEQLGTAIQEGGRWGRWVAQDRKAQTQRPRVLCTPICIRTCFGGSFPVATVATRVNFSHQLLTVILCRSKCGEAEGKESWSSSQLGSQDTDTSFPGLAGPQEEGH